MVKPAQLRDNSDPAGHKHNNDMLIRNSAYVREVGASLRNGVLENVRPLKPLQPAGIGCE